MRGGSGAGSAGSNASAFLGSQGLERRSRGEVRRGAGLIIREGGEELFLFSSDFPHPQGARDPIGRFEATFAGLSEEGRDRFYRRNFEDMFLSA